ncbi:MAG: histone deacetylase family protein, partial [Burkholderiaceae bacterium]|nr:histone deacetylase family protein [Burkholderiaceae bacterium]
MKTGYYTHRACAAHEMGSWHPESPQRLAAINDHLIGIGLAPHLVSLQPPPASWEAIRRAHSEAYLQQLQAKIPKRGYVPLDPDTAINSNSWEAALHAAGAVIDATDRVIAGELDNAFCAVRPPGHHARPGAAMGFCLLNNVAIGALHALQQHGLQRVAIIDFDVH